MPKQSKRRAKDLVLCALFAALLALCAWIYILVGDIAVTMQTFGLFLTLGLLGGKRGTTAVFLYLLLGAVGLPVFSGFQSGLGILLSPTGGYLLGFLAAAGVYWVMTARQNTPKGQLVAMILGLCVCYAFGCIWFSAVYLQGKMGLLAVLLKCVVPYLIPDGMKLALAYFLAQKMRKFV